MWRIFQPCPVQRSEPQGRENVMENWGTWHKMARKCAKIQGDKKQDLLNWRAELWDSWVDFTTKKRQFDRVTFWWKIALRPIFLVKYNDVTGQCQSSTSLEIMISKCRCSKMSEHFRLLNCGNSAKFIFSPEAHASLRRIQSRETFQVGDKLQFTILFFLIPNKSSAWVQIHALCAPALLSGFDFETNHNIICNQSCHMHYM